MFKSTNILFRDISLLLVAGMLFLLIMAIAHINKSEEEDAEIDSPGEIIAEIFWDDALPVDVDMWMLTPVSDTPLFYRNRSNSIGSLLRDDLGSTLDGFMKNDEIIFIRGIKAGTYKLNIHYYSAPGSHQEQAIEVLVRVSLKKPSISRKELYKGKHILLKPRDEAPVFTFTLDEDGKVLSSGPSGERFIGNFLQNRGRPR
jgi:hypothetical protein